MLSDLDLKAQLPHVLDTTDFTFLGECYVGKVRDSYVQGEKRFLVASDRLSGFDVVLSTIPFKGQVLTQMAAHWFAVSKSIVPNHLLDVPDPNVMLVQNCEIIPIEVVVRAYLAGSAARDYEAGRSISGVHLPAGLRPHQKLPEVIVTPSTKEAQGKHDTPISEEDIVSRGIVSRARWGEIREVALSLFRLGEQITSNQGLILVDTKYEFGLLGEKLILADEIHTMDSSRYWVAKTYADRFAQGEAPEMLDKEPVRQWLLSQGYQGQGKPPVFDDERRVQIARHYIDSFTRVTGRPFSAEVGPVKARVESALQKFKS